MKFIRRVGGLLRTPATEWLIIDRQPAARGKLIGAHVAILAAIPAVCGFVGLHLFGISLPDFGTLHIWLRSELVYAALTYGFAFAVVGGLAAVINFAAPLFGGRANFANALKLAVYSPTPYWLAGVFQIHPRAALLQPVFGLYGLFLLWTGLPWLMRVPSRTARTSLYVAAAGVAAVALFAIAGWGTWALVGPSGVL